jgi:hypothetical protein
VKGRLLLAAIICGVIAAWAGSLHAQMGPITSPQNLSAAITPTSVAATGQISTTHVPSGTAATDASIYANAATCASNRPLVSALVNNTRVGGFDCEGDAAVNSVTSASNSSTATDWNDQGDFIVVVGNGARAYRFNDSLSAVEFIAVGAGAYTSGLVLATTLTLESNAGATTITGTGGVAITAAVSNSTANQPLLIDDVLGIALTGAANSSLKTCTASTQDASNAREGTILKYVKSNVHHICWCKQTGSGTYGWQAMNASGDCT